LTYVSVYFTIYIVPEAFINTPLALAVPA